MHLQKLHVSNFRALKAIDVEFEGLVAVIIGPNAIGKTTILEAIRLAKSILAPRTQGEATQVLYSLGVMSPHMPQRVFPNAIAANPDQPTIVKCSFVVEDEEIAQIENLVPQLTFTLALQSAGLSFPSPAQAMGFLNSPSGKNAVQAAAKQMTAELAALKASRRVNLNLTIDYKSGAISGEFPAQQTFFVGLEQSLEPSQALFSYFPADRAMPVGEQQVQLGMADTNQQLESYNSQPALKYNRLKNMIFNSIIGSANGRETLNQKFNLIFDRILKGRCLGEIGVNEIGMLSIPIIDTETKASFEIDGLSSGEKGLLLTFLLISQSVAKHGMILLDEPELHLNPAVCRDLLQFLVDEYSSKLNIQAIICSHSAEILAGAFERSTCSLFHLRNGSTLARVRHKDQGEIRDALKRLGSSESEALLFRGTISVEGIHDVEILQAGFDDMLRRYKLKQLGGRGVIEADIKELQQAEKRGDEIGSQFFLFDLDRRPTTLQDSDRVRLRQLKRYCLENYLLDADIITDLTRDADFSAQPIQSVTEASAVMKKLALAQLNDVAARNVFSELKLEKVAFDMKALNVSDPKQMSVSLGERIKEITELFAGLNEKNFQETFESRFAAELTALHAQWDDRWKELCNGKLLLEDMRKAGYLRGDLLRTKRRIINEMRLRGTEAWHSLDSLLKELIAVPSS